MDVVFGEVKKYKILDKVGEGRTGHVYRAKRSSIAGKVQDIVAIKVLKNGNHFQELVKEFKIVQKIQSSRIVRYFSLERINKQTAIVMEYIEGYSLSQLSYHNMPLYLKSYVKSEVKIALFDLQKQGLFHGDLSPNNIMISRSGEVKLIDFANHFNKNYKAYGTVNFMPKEHINGQHNGIKTDLKALDMIFPNIDAKLSLNKKDIIKDLEKYIKQQKNSVIKTAIIFDKKCNRIAVMLFFLVSMVVAMIKWQNLVAQNLYWNLSLNSARWYYIEVENTKYRGFLPLKITTNQSDLKIKWQSGSKSGHLNLDLSKYKKQTKLNFDQLVYKK